MGISLIDLVREFYSDGAVHRNTDLYKYVSRNTGEPSTPERNHVLRATQERLSMDGFLVNVGRAKWQKA